MLKALSPGAIGVTTKSLEERVAAARNHGFQAVELDIDEIVGRVDVGGAESVQKVMGEIKPAGWGLPVDWRGEEANWRAGLEKLRKQAAAAEAVGCTRTFTWILSGSNDRPMAENRQFHIERFTPIAEILGEHGCSLGLEFLGPKTLRDQFKHPFVYRMEDMLEMGREIGPNVGLLLDCWHWYTSGSTVDDLRKLTAKDVVYVHVNDAPEGVALDQQVDNVRCLPGETGVIPIGEFLKVLSEIGYDASVVPEPFKKELGDLPSDDERLRVVSEGMDKIFRQAGL
jgi:sugar phosphate isomerase/epimerase